MLAFISCEQAFKTTWIYALQQMQSLYHTAHLLMLSNICVMVLYDLTKEWV